jgi:uncharacterized metal-binding protein YceD (DUF177 family)
VRGIVHLRRPGAGVGDRHDLSESFEVEPFDLYGRHHEVTAAHADVGVTRLAEGLHLDTRFSVTVQTTCDRTLEPTEITLEFGDSELLSGPNDAELCVQDWRLDLPAYARRALPSEVPMQVFCQNTSPVRPNVEGDEKDPRWRGLDGLFASGF